MTAHTPVRLRSNRHSVAHARSRAQLLIAAAIAVAIVSSAAMWLAATGWAAAQPLPISRTTCSVESRACTAVIDPQPQQKERWCVPAAVRAAFEPRRSQADLASALQTTAAGSYLHRVPRVAGPSVTFTFGMASYRSGADLMRRIRLAVSTTSRPVVLGVEGRLLPYWPRGMFGLHAIVAVGWSGTKVVVWDPLDEPWNASYHLVSPEDLVRAGTLNARAALWPS